MLFKKLDADKLIGMAIELDLADLGWDEGQLAELEARTNGLVIGAPDGHLNGAGARNGAVPGAEDRRKFIQAQIAAWVGKLRLEAALAAESLGKLEGMRRLVALRSGLLLGVIRRCRANPRADTCLAVYALITFLSDNEDGLCWLSITRLCRILKRSREAIVNAIASLEADGLIGVNRSGGLASSYWPLVPAAFENVELNPLWIADALAPTARQQLFASPEVVIEPENQSTLLDQSSLLDRSSVLDRHRSSEVDQSAPQLVKDSRGTSQGQSSSISLSN
jgi:hypothetical protein